MHTLILAGILLSAGVYSAERDFEPSYAFEGKTLVLNGVGVREATVFNVDVYRAALYLEKKSTDANYVLKSKTPKYLLLHFVREVTASQMKEAFEDGFQKNCPVEKDSRCGEWKQTLANIVNGLQDMKIGDDMALGFHAGHVVLNISGQKKAETHAEGFDEALLRVWLGDPPNSALKKGLLGQ